MRGPLLAMLAVTLVPGCEDQARTEERRRTGSAAALVAEGRIHLAGGRHEDAVKRFKQAMSATPEDVTVYLNLAEAFRAQGNPAGAVLTLKQAEAIAGDADPGLKRSRADLYLAMHDVPNAIVELKALEAMDLLTDKEIRQLALYLGSQGRLPEAFTTLERILRRSPDDPESRVVEAELLLLRGDEVLGARLMDRLLAEHPGLTSARLLRARYFLNNARNDRPLLDKALEDLALVPPEDLSLLAVTHLKTTVLNELGRFEESAALLERLAAENPRSAETLALLAETRLKMGQGPEAQALVDRVLTLEPGWARALYVRGWAREQQRQPEAAQRDYEAALATDPGFVPALSRLWNVYEARGRLGDAVATLEKLYRLNALSRRERVELARLYSITWANVERGQELIAEALRRDPRNTEYRAIKARLARGRPRGGPAVEIIRHR